MLALFTEAGMFIAQERGYFREEGLDVDLVRFARGGEQTAPLATGGLEFGVGAPDSSLFNAAARDVPLKLVSPNAVSNRDDTAGWLVVRQALIDNGRFKELKDLRGLRLGTHGVGPNGYIDEAVLDDLQDPFLRYGTQQQRVESSKVVDRSYVEYALQRLGRLPD
jgi:NitT/TauT family transport system substrate-binding protein